MQTTGVFKVHTLGIKVPSGHTVPFMPFGDVHYGAPLHATEVFDEYLESARDLMEDSPKPLF